MMAGSLMGDPYLDREREYRRMAEEMSRQQNYAQSAQMNHLAALQAGQYVPEPEQPNPVLLLLPQGDSA